VTRIDESAPLEEVVHALEGAWAIDPGALVEHFARGREVTCGVLDLHGAAARALPPTEISSPEDPFYTYEARYAAGRSVHTCPAALGPEVTRQVERVALAAHRALGCRDLSRVDFVVGDDGNPSAITLLEVNTMPGMTATSLYPEEAQAAGLTFAALCDALVRSAHERGTPRRVAALKMP
jgi:D-alanine-D-alanine ligase